MFHVYGIQAHFRLERISSISSIVMFLLKQFIMGYSGLNNIVMPAN